MASPAPSSMSMHNASPTSVWIDSSRNQDEVLCFCSHQFVPRALVNGRARYSMKVEWKKEKVQGVICGWERRGILCSALVQNKTASRLPHANWVLGKWVSYPASSIHRRQPYNCLKLRYSIHGDYEFGSRPAIRIPSASP